MGQVQRVSRVGKPRCLVTLQKNDKGLHDHALKH